MRNTLLVLTALSVAGLAFGQVSVVGGNGATLSDLAGTDTLVTVVLKARNVEDPNLRIERLYSDHFSVITPQGQISFYPFSAVKAVRVQGGKVARRAVNPDLGRALTIEQQNVVVRAEERAQEVFDSSNDNMTFKMDAAAILAAGISKDARQYLHSLASSNDLRTALQAVLRLYVAGESVQADRLVAEGLESGNRLTRALAAKLAGLLGVTDAIPSLSTLVRDRWADLAAPAACALARLGSEEGLESTLGMLTQRNEEKAEAAVLALSELGGEAVVEEVKRMLETTEGLAQYRVARVLYRLGEPEGKTFLLEDVFMKQPTLARDAAIILAADGDFTTKQWLVNELAKRYTETDDELVFRARAAVALIEGGDLSAVSVLQELLRVDKKGVVVKACSIMAHSGRRIMIAVLQPTIESADTETALAACQAIEACASTSFRDRFIAADL